MTQTGLTQLTLTADIPPEFHDMHKLFSSVLGVIAGFSAGSSAAKTKKTKPPFLRRFAPRPEGPTPESRNAFFLFTFGHHFGERIKGCIGNISLWMNCHTGQGATGKGFCMDRDQAVLHCQTCQGVAISEGLCFNSLNSPQGRTRGMSEMPRQNASPTKVYKTHQNTPTHVQSFDCLF